MSDDRLRPPRLYIPIEVRRAAGREQGGVCPCGCGTPCWADAKKTKALVDWDHDPALRRRDINKDGTDYVPPQLDPAYIVGRCHASHLVKTSGAGATTAGSDIGAIKKERKREKALNRAEKPKPKWGKRPLCSKNGFQNQRGKSQWPKRVLPRTHSNLTSTASSGFPKRKPR